MDDDQIGEIIRKRGIKIRKTGGGCWLVIGPDGKVWQEWSRQGAWNRCLWLCNVK